MAADYKEQYRPDQLEDFWPNEILKQNVVVLVTLAVIMFFAILPVLTEYVGLPVPQHHEEPANPRGATPAGIKPEWYFLATYQYLRLMPTRFLGMSGKTLGVLSQQVIIVALITLPFWYRKKAGKRPSNWYRLAVTAGVLGFVALTFWGGWPEKSAGGEEELIPIWEYVRTHPMMFMLAGLALVVFYFMLDHERRAIRRILDSPPPPTPRQEEGRP